MRVGVVAVGLLGILVGTVAGQDADSASPTAEEEVLETQAMRFRAMTSRDLEALAAILSEDLTYTHTTGLVETKSEFLASLESGETRYLSIEPNDVVIRIYGETAVLTGVSDMRLDVRGDQLSFSIRFIEVYHKQISGWQLVTWQSTRLPDR